MRVSLTKPLFVTAAICFSTYAAAGEFSVMWLSFDKAKLAGNYETARGILVQELADADKQAGGSAVVSRKIKLETLQQLANIDEPAGHLDLAEKDLIDAASLFHEIVQTPDVEPYYDPLHRLEAFYAIHGRYSQLIDTLRQELAALPEDSASERERLAIFSKMGKYRTMHGDLPAAKEAYEQMLPLVTPKNVKFAESRVRFYSDYIEVLRKLHEDGRIKDVQALVDETRKVPDEKTPPALMDMGAAISSGNAQTQQNWPIVTGGTIADPEQCRPRYPDAARELDLRGTSVVHLKLDEDGHLSYIDVTHSSGSVLLDRETVEALKHCRFKPGLRDGKRITSSMTLTYQWKPD